MRTRRSAWQNVSRSVGPSSPCPVAHGYTATRTPSTGGVPLSSPIDCHRAGARTWHARCQPWRLRSPAVKRRLVHDGGAARRPPRVATRRAASAATVVMSLFVNPEQFGPGEDLDRYPRDEEADVAVAAAEGADLVFAPGAEVVYPDGFAAHVDPGPLAADSRAACAQGTSAASRRCDAPLRARATAVGVLRREGLPAARDRARGGARPRARRGGRRGADLRDADGLALSSRNRFLWRPRRARDHAERRVAGGRAPLRRRRTDATCWSTPRAPGSRWIPTISRCAGATTSARTRRIARPSCSWLRGSERRA